MNEIPKSHLSWDDYYMMLVFCINAKSPDPSTKHGAIIVDPEHRPMGLGFNGAPAGCKDELIPWDKRPDKYFLSIHSETNAIIRSSRNLVGCTIFVTGMPCHKCMGDILQAGIVRVVYGPQGSVFGRQTSYCKDGNDEWAIKLMLEGRNNFSLEEYRGDILKNLFISPLYFANRVNKPEVVSMEMGEYILTLQRKV